MCVTQSQRSFTAGALTSVALLSGLSRVSTSFLVVGFHGPGQMVCAPVKQATRTPPLEIHPTRTDSLNGCVDVPERTHEGSQWAR